MGVDMAHTLESTFLYSKKTLELRKTKVSEVLEFRFLSR